MSRRSTNTNTVQLFPFLAVLMSAMGALCLLLLAITRQAQLSRTNDTEKSMTLPTPYVAPELGPLPELVEYPPLPLLPPLPKELVTPKEFPSLPALADLPDPRLPARAELDRIQSKISETRSESPSKQSAGEAALAQLAIHIEELRRQLAELDEKERSQAENLTLRKEQFDLFEKKRKKMEAKANHVENRYAIIPYTGPNGTPRRPIYFEINKASIVLQPEGIEIPAELFAQRQITGDPLKELVEGLVDELRVDGPDGVPYPLFIVRPDGIAGFYVAQRSLTRLNVSLGYELVPQDAELAFDAPNPKVRKVAEKIIASFKTRQQELVDQRPVDIDSMIDGDFRGPRRSGGARTGAGYPGTGNSDQPGAEGTGNAGDGRSAQSGTGRGNRGDLGMSPSRIRSLHGDFSNDFKGSGAGGSAVGAAESGMDGNGPAGGSDSVGNPSRKRLGLSIENKLRQGLADGPYQTGDAGEGGFGQNGNGIGGASGEADDGVSAPLTDNAEGTGQPGTSSSAGKGLARGNPNAPRGTGQVGGGEENGDEAADSNMGQSGESLPAGEDVLSDDLTNVSRFRGRVSPDQMARARKAMALGKKLPPGLAELIAQNQNAAPPSTQEEASAREESSFDQLVFQPSGSKQGRNSGSPPMGASPSFRAGDQSDPRTEQIAGMRFDRKPIRRDILVEVRADLVILHPDMVYLPLRDERDLHMVLGKIREATDKQMREWGETDAYHYWQPVVFCYVRSAGLENYYMMRLGFLNSWLEIDHKLIDNKLMLEFPQWDSAKGAKR